LRRRFEHLLLLYFLGQALGCGSGRAKVCHVSDLGVATTSEASARQNVASRLYARRVSLHQVGEVFASV
jgi:hypothetical protein